MPQSLCLTEMYTAQRSALLSCRLGSKACSSGHTRQQQQLEWELPLALATARPIACISTAHTAHKLTVPALQHLNASSNAAHAAADLHVTCGALMPRCCAAASAVPEFACGGELSKNWAVAYQGSHGNIPETFRLALANRF